MTTTFPYTKKPFASSILLWLRTDQPRQTGMDYWKGPHSKIISPTPGIDEYRQIHLAGRHPRRRDRHSRGPADRRRRRGHLRLRALAVTGPQADPTGVQGRDQRVPA